MYVLLVVEDDDEGHLREIVGPFQSRAEAAKFRETVDVEHTEIVELREPHRPAAQ
jgi:hypothetical protein